MARTASGQVRLQGQRARAGRRMKKQPGQPPQKAPGLEQRVKTSDADRRIRQADRLARVLRVLQLLQSRGNWNVPSIASELEVSTRTVWRDLKVLEFAGVPYAND